MSMMDLLTFPHNSCIGRGQIHYTWDLGSKVHFMTSGIRLARANTDK